MSSKEKNRIAQLPPTDDDVITDCLLIHCPLGSPISFFLYFFVIQRILQDCVMTISKEKAKAMAKKSMSCSALDFCPAFAFAFSFAFALDCWDERVERKRKEWKHENEGVCAGRGSCSAL